MYSDSKYEQISTNTVIEGLNLYIQERNPDAEGFLVLHKNIERHSTIKMFKVITYTLWYVYRGKTKEVFSLSKATKEVDDSFTKEVEVEFVKSLFRWSYTEDFNKVINNTYI